ncbi:RNA polymerase subunit sigma-70 [Tenacibaculum litopenaei]|jgi:RNA polymerase sigma-70 factor (ECF subfamily)|uniref:RNA polymerase sigma factor n=1 Tax=Tenacibaculum litopenaei TaxID=396016 RepID=UPI0038931FDB
MSETKQLHQTIIEACKLNDAKAQMQLYDRYSQAMYTVALRYVKEVAEAEDVMQEAFIKAFKKIHLYKEEVSFGAWLKKIVVNQSIDSLKKKKIALVSINEEITEQAYHDTWEVAPHIQRADVVKAISELSTKYQVVLNLYLLEGYDHSEISQILGISEVTSRTQLMRGRKQVQQILKKKHYA